MPIAITLAGILRYGGFVPKFPVMLGFARRLAIGKVLQNAMLAGIPMPTGNVALKIFQRYGLGIRRADFFGIYTGVKKLYDKMELQQKAGFPAPMPENIIGELRRDFGRKYTYIFERTSIDPITGETVVQHKAFTTSRKLGEEKMYERLREIISDSAPRFKMETVEDFKLVLVAKRAGS